MKYATKKRVTIFLGVCTGIGIGFAFVNPYEKSIPLGELILQLSGSRGEFSMGFNLPELIEYMIRMMPTYFIMMFLGNKLYRHFCTASIYVFSRCPNRLKWYRGEVIHLLINVCFFEITFVISAILISMLRYKVTFSLEGCKLLAYHITIYTLWIFVGVLLMNLIAIKVGSSTSFMAVVGIQMIFTAGLSLINIFERLRFPNSIIEVLLKFNPVAHTVLGWHNGTSFRYSISFTNSIILFFIGSIVVTVVGGILIQRQDLLMADIEMETI